MTIDIHRHVGHAASRTARAAEDIVRELDELRVDCAVLLAGEAQPLMREEELAADADTGPLVEAYLRTGRITEQIERCHCRVCDHSLVFAAVEANPGRLYGGYILNPWLVDSEFDRARGAFRQYGLRYIKLHPWVNAFAPDDLKVMGPVADLAAELEVPLWFHTSYGPGSEPERMARLAEAFPEVQVILGHGLCGTDGRRVAGLLTTHGNLWLDVAEATADAIGQVVAAAPGDRIMLASDDPWGMPCHSYSLAAQMVKVLNVTAGKPSLMQAILGRNAARLLKLGR